MLVRAVLGLPLVIFSMLIPTIEDSEPSCCASFAERPVVLPGLMPPLCIEGKERADLMLRIMLSGDQSRNKGRSVGRQIAIMPTPSSSMPQKVSSDTTPMSSVARRPATLAFARTDEVSREDQYGGCGMSVLTWGSQDLDENDHSRDPAGGCSVMLVSKFRCWPREIQCDHTALQRGWHHIQQICVSRAFEDQISTSVNR